MPPQQSLKELAYATRFEEDELEEDEFEEDGDGPVGGSGAPSHTATHSALMTTLSIGKTVASTGISAVGNVQKVAALTAGVGSATSAALLPVIAVTGPIGIALSVLDSLMSAWSAAKTYAHITALEQILRLHGHQARPGTREAILFACRKKNKKLKRKGLGCIPIIGSIANTVYTAGRSIQKRVQGTRGVERRQHASVLWQNTLIGDACAIEACKELLGLKVYNLINGLTDGHLVLKKKLKSL